MKASVAETSCLFILCYVRCSKVADFHLPYITMSLYSNISTVQDVNQLAMGCFGLTDNFDQNTQPLVEELCDSYGSLIEDDR